MFKKEWMIDMMEQKTILIVDDENMMREAVASYLEKQGYHVLQAETGTQASGKRNGFLCNPGPDASRYIR